MSRRQPPPPPRGSPRRPLRRGIFTFLNPWPFGRFPNLYSSTPARNSMAGHVFFSFSPLPCRTPSSFLHRPHLALVVRCSLAAHRPKAATSRAQEMQHVAAAAVQRAGRPAASLVPWPLAPPGVGLPQWTGRPTAWLRTWLR